MTAAIIVLFAVATGLTWINEQKRPRRRDRNQPEPTPKETRMGKKDDRYDVTVATTTEKIEEKNVSDQRARELEDLAESSPNVLWTSVKSR